MAERQAMTDLVTMPVVTADNITFSYPSRPLFQQLSFMIASGVSFIIGDESTGKTSLLALLADELQPQQGHIHFNTPAQDKKEQVFWVNPQTDRYDNMKVSDYLKQLPSQYSHCQPDLLTTCIEGFMLSPHLDKTFSMLSTGTKRKVWIAAALASKAPLILLDNPYAALDGTSIRFLNQHLAQQLHQNQQAIVITCYEIPDQFADEPFFVLPALT